MAKDGHLLVDGYNVIHAWEELRGLLHQDSGMARDKLAEIVRVIHDIEGLRTTLVFDGQGKDIEIERPTEETTFSLLYAPAGMTADSLIEQMVRSSKSPKSVTVASRDNMVIETVLAQGANAISPDALADWVAACEKREGEALRRHQKEVDQKWKQRGN